MAWGAAQPSVSVEKVPQETIGLANDPCLAFSLQATGLTSSCVVSTGACLSLFWKDAARTQLYHLFSGEPAVWTAPVTCMEAAFHHRSSRDNGRPHWLGLRVPVDLLGFAGASSLMEIMERRLFPLLREVPFSDLTEQLSVSMEQAFNEAKQIGRVGDTSLEAEKFQTAVSQVIETSEMWESWTMYMDALLTLASTVRFTDGDFMARIAPFLNLHADIVLSLPTAVRSEMKRVIESSVLSELRLTYHSELQSSLSRNLAAWYAPRRFIQGSRNIEIANLLMRMEDFENMRRGEPHTWTGPSDMDVGLSRLFEQTVANLLMATNRAEMQSFADDLAYDKICPKLHRVARYIAWAFPSTVVDKKRCIRLIMSLAHFCKPYTSVEERRKVVESLPALDYEYFSDTPSFLVTPSVGDISFIGKLFLETSRGEVSLKRHLIVQFVDSPAEGEVGPRNHWVSVMASQYFRAGKGIFEYSDDRRVFLKPAAEVKARPLRAAGRLIGIALRYGIPLEAKLTPCAIALLRLPDVHFNLESAVEAEDPQFVAGLVALTKLSDEEAAVVYPDLTLEMDGKSVPVTKKNIDAYVEAELKKKGILSIRDQMFHVAAGIRDAVPPGTLDLFDIEEATAMINGAPSLTAAHLISNIEVKSAPERSLVVDWLFEVLANMEEEDLFMFNKFVTGVRQPPVGPEAPWIHLSVTESIHVDSLPVAQTCFSNIFLPNYPDIDTLRAKLLYAVQNGSHTLELV